MDASWPLRGPVLPTPVVEAPEATSAKGGEAGQETKSSRENKQRKRRRDPALKDASEDYHNFIEAVEKSAKQRATAAAAAEEEEASMRRRKRLPVGTTRLFDHGRLRLVPAPSAHPIDPLNLSTRRKWTAIGAMCCAGSVAVAGEFAIGSLLLPIFALEYAGIDPHLIRDANRTAAATNMSALAAQTLALVPLIDTPVDVVLPAGTVLPPDRQIALLATVPMFVTAVASYILIPLSVAVGRRPVLLLASACTWAGALWAGLSSQSVSIPPFTQHLAARAVMAVGASAAAVLMPLIAANDLVFLHQRHTVLATLVATQAAVTAALSAAAPYVAAMHDWRFLYYALAAAGFTSWLSLLAFVPETRWVQRTKAELAGVSAAGPRYRDTPRSVDYSHGSRTLWTDLGVLASPFRLEWQLAANSMMDLVRTALLPLVLWAAVVNAALLTILQAMVQQLSVAMQAQGWPFAMRGIGAVVALGGAAVVAVALAGPLGNAFSLAVTRHLRAQQVQRESMAVPDAPLAAGRTQHRRPTSRREAEHSLPLMVLPFVLAISGCFLFGGAAQAGLHWAVLMGAAFLVALALLLALSALSVLLIESHPNWAGACLAHSAGGLRLMVAGLLFRGHIAARLVRMLGFLNGWSVYAEVLLVASLGVPAFFFGGRQLREWTAGTVAGDVMVEYDDDENGADGLKMDRMKMSPESLAASTPGSLMMSVRLALTEQPAWSGPVITSEPSARRMVPVRPVRPPRPPMMQMPPTRPDRPDTTKGVRFSLHPYDDYTGRAF